MSDENGTGDAHAPAVMEAAFLLTSGETAAKAATAILPLVDYNAAAADVAVANAHSYNQTAGQRLEAEEAARAKAKPPAQAIRAARRPHNLRGRHRARAGAVAMGRAYTARHVVCAGRGGGPG